MALDNQSFSYELITMNNLAEISIISFYEQAFIILPSLNELSLLNSLHTFMFYHPMSLKFLVYIEEQLDSYSIASIPFEQMSMLARSIDLYEYFIFDEGELISFATIQWYTDVVCNDPVITTLNQFNKKSMKWNSRLNYHEKFMNFYGCELVLMLPTDNRKFNFALVNKDQTQFKIYGIVPMVFQAISKRFNFQDAYQPVLISNVENFFQTQSMKLVHINGMYKIPSVYFDVAQLRLLWEKRTKYVKN